MVDLSGKIDKAHLNLNKRGWVSLNQAALLLDISYPTILKWRNEEKIMCVRVGGVFRVTKEEINRIKSGTQP